MVDVPTPQPLPDAEREAIKLVRVVGHSGQRHHDSHPIGAILPVVDGKLPGDWEMSGAHHRCEPLPPETFYLLRDRAITAAAYRLSCSSHEWTDADSEATARFALVAVDLVNVLTARATQAEAAHAQAIRERDAALARAQDGEMACGAMQAIHELLDSGGIPRGTFADDHVRNLVALYNQALAREARLRATLTLEGVAKGLHAVECSEADRDQKLRRLPPVTQWADPWSPGSARQLARLHRHAEVFIAALATSELEDRA